MIPIWIHGLVFAFALCVGFIAWRSRRVWHKHAWQLVHRNAIGRFEKQEGYQGASDVLCKGRVEKCSCGEWRIVPEVPGYRPVAVSPRMAAIL